MSIQTDWQEIVVPEKLMNHMAEGLRASQEGRDAKDTPIFQEVLSHLGVQRSVVDIGAGVGRFTVPLAANGCHVWAVEPSELMRAHLQEAVTVKELESAVHTLPGLWPDVEVPAAEVALAAFVIHFSPRPREFVRAMETAATERCVVAIHVDPMFSGINDLWRVFHPDRMAPQPPVFRDLYPLLLEEGIVADVHVYEEPRNGGFWRDPAKALEGLAELLQIETDVERQQLAVLLRERVEKQGGTFSFAPQASRIAVVSWRPRMT